MTFGQINRGQFGGDRFTIVSNLAVRDSRLSYKARGLLAALASHRDGWGITAERLAADSPDGVSAVTSGLKELERHGYMRRLRERRADGTLGGSRWVITDDPDTLADQVAALESSLGSGTTLHERQNSRSEPTCDFPSLDEPSLVEPKQDDRGTKKTNHKKTKGLSGEREEEDARAREASSPSSGAGAGRPAAGAAAPEAASGERAGGTDDGFSGVGVSLGVAGGRREGASVVSVDFVRDLARVNMPEGQKLSSEDHLELAALLDEARPVVDTTEGLEWDELLAYLRQGWWKSGNQRRFDTFVGVLKTRLRPNHIRSKALVWATEQRTDNGASPALGSLVGTRAESDPFAGTASCERHPHATRLPGGACGACRSEEIAADRSGTAASSGEVSECESGGQESTEVPDPPPVEELVAELRGDDGKDSLKPEGCAEHPGAARVAGRCVLCRHEAA